MTEEKQKNMRAAAFVLNAAVVVLELIGLSLSVSSHGVKLFEFYTEDSNIFALASSLLFCVYTVKGCRDKSAAVPRWVHLLKYISTCCLAVTFIVVITVLAPMAGEGGFRFMLFGGSMLYHHFMCPVIALISFIFFEKEPRLEARHSLYALIPTLVYAFIVLALNVMRVMEGPYPFFHVYEQPLYASVLWFIGIIGGAYAVACLVRYLNAQGKIA